MSIPVNMSETPPDEPVDLNRDINDCDYWWSRTPAERWACANHLNRQKYRDIQMDRSNLVLHHLTLEDFNKMKDEEYVNELAKQDHRSKFDS